MENIENRVSGANVNVEAEKVEEEKFGFDAWSQWMKKDPIFRATKEEVEKVVDTPYIVDNIIAENTITVLSGLPGTYKSWISEHLGLCVASGKPFLNRFEIKKQGAVLYLLFEGASGSYRIRTRKLIQEDVPNMAILPSMGWYFNTEEKDPSSKDIRMNNFTEAVKQTCIKENVVLLIIDTYRASFTGDENSSKDTTIILNKIREIMKASGTSVWLITHIRKQQNSEKINYNDIYSLVRGSSAAPGAFDYVYGLEYVADESSPKELVTLKLHQAKNRYSELLAPIKIEMREEGEKGKERVTFHSEYIARELTEKQEQIRNELIELLKKNKSLTFNKIIPQNAKSRNSKITQLKEMVTEGLITKDEKTGEYSLKGQQIVVK